MGWEKQFLEKLQKEALEVRAVAVEKKPPPISPKPKTPPITGAAVVVEKEKKPPPSTDRLKTVPLLNLDGESLSRTADGNRQSRFCEVSLYDMQVELGHEEILGLSSFTDTELVDFCNLLDSQMTDDFWKRFNTKYCLND